MTSWSVTGGASHAFAPPARADLGGRGGWVLIQGQLPPQPFAGGVSRAVRVGYFCVTGGKRGMEHALEQPARHSTEPPGGVRPRTEIPRPLPAACYMCTCLMSITCMIMFTCPCSGVAVYPAVTPLRGHYIKDRYPMKGTSSPYPGMARSIYAPLTPA